MTESISLSRPITPIAHSVLRTVADARDYMVAMPEGVGRLPHWQQAARLCMALGEHPTPRAVAEFTEQLELALMLSSRGGQCAA